MFRYKERSPEETIRCVKELLNNIGIKVSETWFESKVDHVYSLRVNIIGTGYGANGKGITKELALASAYGELSERLGNGIIFKHQERKKTYKAGFFYFPDEIMLTKDYFLNDNNNEVLSELLKPLCMSHSNAIECWDQIMDSWISIPFQNESNATRVFLPYQMLKVYGSNGMAAGNTKEEAFVQAVSEIFERNCLQQIIRKRLCPPIINREYVSREYPVIEEILTSIEKEENLTVEVRDCSINMGFPVVGLCVYDNIKHTDSVSFGAHPVEEIALERAVTELFQGRNTNDISNLVTNRSCEERFNILSILKNGIGYFPYQFHMHQYSYEVNYNQNREFYSNSEIKKSILDLCSVHKKNIYTRYIQIGAMYVTHVIIPEMSEVFHYDVFQFQCLNMQHKVKQLFSNPDGLSPVELQACLEFLDYIRKTPEFDLNLSKDFSVLDNRIKQKRILRLLISGFNELQMYGRALQYLELLKKYISQDEYMCLRCIFDLYKEKYDDTDAYQYLIKYFSNTIISNSINYLDYSNAIKSFKTNNSTSGFYHSEEWLNCVYKLKHGILVR